MDLGDSRYFVGIYFGVVRMALGIFVVRQIGLVQRGWYLFINSLFIYIFQQYINK